MRQYNKKSKLKELIKIHIINNLKEYCIALIIFIIGLIIGIVFINNISEIQKTEIVSYINEFTSNLKNNTNVNKLGMLKTSIMDNLSLAIILWFAGSTVIGLPIVYGTLGFRGFCLGYTISTLVACMGTWKGFIFAICAIFLQNVLIIPSILALAVSGTKLYKSIMKDRRKENVKLEILRHTVFSMIVSLVLVISSFIEVYISTNLIEIGIKII